MTRSTETGMDRLRKISWLQWGLITIFAGLMSGVIGSLQGPPKNKAEAAGRAAAALLIIVIGVGLIIVHFVRPKRSQGKLKSPGGAVSGRAKRPAANSAPPGLPPRRPGAKR
ncbi:MAG: hypothetical protein M3552_07850 [Planctomycetota bacterium]|nr:hypothetical protein [Planctomycetota bacterium]